MIPLTDAQVAHAELTRINDRLGLICMLPVAFLWVFSILNGLSVLPAALMTLLVIGFWTASNSYIKAVVTNG